MPNTTYYTRAYVKNSQTTLYGDEISFTTTSFDKEIVFNPNRSYGTLADIEGNTYKTISIGNQVWMAENLKTKKLNDGEEIQLASNNQEWSNLSVPGFCWYANDEDTYGNTYGALYNWYSVNTGWHVPSESEWTELFDYYIGYAVAANKLRETGYTHWGGINIWPPHEGDNESGFTALPSGIRIYSSDPSILTGAFIGDCSRGSWWTSSQYPKSEDIEDWSDTVFSYEIPKNTGVAVRCTKD